MNKLLLKVIYNQNSHQQIENFSYLKLLPALDIISHFHFQKTKIHVVVLYCDCALLMCYFYICICAYMAMCLCDTLIWVCRSMLSLCKYKSKTLGVFLCHSPSYYLEKGLSLNWKIIICSRLADHCTVRIGLYLYPHPNAWLLGIHSLFPLFYIGPRDSNPSPHVQQYSYWNISAANFYF